MRRKTRLGLLRPDAYYDSIYEIDLDCLKKKGMRTLLVDIDNTLVEWNGKLITPELREWFRGLTREGFSVCILSNNKHHRVSAFAAELGVPFVALAGKPRRGAYKRALATAGSQPGETAVIGDQIFTDVLGGNRAGLYTILVVPVSGKEMWSTRMVRSIERRVLHMMDLEGAVGRGARGS